MDDQLKELIIKRGGELMKQRLREALDSLPDETTLTLDEIEGCLERASRLTNQELQDEAAQSKAEAQPLPNRIACPVCGQEARFKGIVEKTVLTIHGNCTFRRRGYDCPTCSRVFPVDVQLGLAPGQKQTHQIREWLAEAGAASRSFRDALRPLLSYRGLVVSESTVERVTVEVGRQLAEANERAALRVDEEAEGEPGADRVYLEVDGTMVPLRDKWSKDGSEGKLNCRYGEVKTGMVFIAGRNEDGMDVGIKRRGVVGTLGGIDVFTILFVLLAKRWGACRAKELVVLGDGAAWIWKLAKRYFPQALQILDYFHVRERLRAVASERFKGRTERAAEWVEAMEVLLKTDKVEDVIKAMSDWKPRGASQAKLLQETLTFFSNNQSRMMYGTYLAKGYFIGSGAIESRCKQLVKARLKEAGMWWRETTAEAVVAIRALMQGTEPWSLQPYTRLLPTT